MAHVIGKAVWDQRGDIRDVISIGKLVRKNDDKVRRNERALNEMRLLYLKPLIVSTSTVSLQI